MKKKLLMLSLALISCVCVAVGFSACGEETHTHDLTAYEAVAATCTEDGNIAYWYCSDCGKYFSDANGTTEISLAGTVVSASGHDYETNFSWTETNGVWTATATRTCANDSTDTETVTAVVTEKENSRTEADCTTAGSVTYIATATFSDNTNETEEKTVTIPATGHTYSDDWTTDGSAHWHAATCEHTTEVSDYAAHTFAADTNGDYVCSICGYKVTPVGSTLALGDNYLVLTGGADSYSTTAITYTAAAEGYYTVTIPTGCLAYVYVETSYSSAKLGLTDATATDIDYTATFAVYANDTITVTFYGIPSGVEAADVYVIDLELTCKEATVEYGSDANPYELSLADIQEQAVTIAAGASCYFTTTATNSLSQIYVSSASLKLYQAGEDGDTLLTLTSDGTNYCYYFYVQYGTTYTFYLKNDTESSITDTINFYSWTPTLAEGTNTVTISKDMTTAYGTTAVYIRYYLPVTAGYVYTLTLGDACDEYVAIKTSSYDGSYLGYNTTYTEYVFGAKSSTDQSLYIFYYGSADSFNVVINISSYEETVDLTADESAATYTPIELDTSTQLTFTALSWYTVSQGYQKAYISYNASEAGDYTLSFDTTVSMWAYYTTTVKLNGTEVASSTNLTEVTLSLSAGVNNIVISIGVSTLYGTVNVTLAVPTSGGDSGEAGNTNTLSVGSNTVEADTDYTFTATTAGTYKFTISGDTEYANVWAGKTDYDSSWSPSYLDVQSAGVTYFTVTLEVDETVTIYLTGSNGVTLTIAATEESGGSGEAGNTNTLSVGANAISLTADEASSGINYTITVDESGTYTFSVETGADAWVIFNNSTTDRITAYVTSFEVELTAGTEYTVSVASWSYAAADYTLTIAKKPDYTINASTSDLSISFNEDDTCTIYVEIGGVYIFNCPDYDGVKVSYTYETIYSDTGYSTYEEKIYNGASYLTLLQGDTITLLFSYTGSTSLSISYVEPATAGTAYSATLDSDNYYVTTTMTITEAGYYTVTLTGDDTTSAYVSISDSAYTYYYNSNNTYCGYIIDYSSYDEVPISITAGTVLTITIGYYGSSTVELSVLIKLDADYVADGGDTSGDDTSGGTSSSYTLTSSGLTLNLTVGTYTVTIDSSAHVNDSYDKWAEANYTQYNLSISNFDSSLSGTYKDIANVAIDEGDSALLYEQGESSYVKLYSETSITIEVYYDCTLTIEYAAA